MNSRQPRRRPPTTASGPVRAAIYCRISSDPEGREVGVERQQEDCRALAERMGMTVVDVVVDNDVSASTKSRKPRPQYDDMLERARRGEFGAILAYSNSRLTRRPREFEDLLDLSQGYGVRIITHTSGEQNLDTADGRSMARNLANWDTREAEVIAERVARAKQQAAVEGRYRGGVRPYGYEKDGVTIREAEAEVIRRATSAVLSGRTIAAVAREINESGPELPVEGYDPALGYTHRGSSQGNRWTPTTLRRVLERPRNAGLIHSGNISGDYEVVGKATWDPIVDEETWRALHGMLRDPSRRKSHGTENKWLGSGIYLCGVEGCGSVMASGFSGGTPSRPGRGAVRHYRCREASHLSIRADHTDDYVTDQLAALLTNPDLSATVNNDDEQQAKDRQKRTELVARRERYESDYVEGIIEGRLYQRAVEKVEAEIAEIDERLTVGVQRTHAGRIINAADPSRTFLAAPVDVQRAVLRLLLEVTVVPAERRGLAWSPARLRIERRVAAGNAPGM